MVAGGDGPAAVRGRGPGRPPAAAGPGGGRRRVLLLAATLAAGGLERQLTLLATHLPPGWRPAVWTAEGGPFLAVLREAGVPVIVDRRSGRRDVRPLLRLAAGIARWRPDVVHAWHWLPAAAAAPVCRLLGVPYIDGTIRLGRPNPEFGRPRRSLMRLADVVVANSAAGLAAWGFAPPRGRVIHNAFDPARLAAAAAAGEAAAAAAAGGGGGPAAAGRPFTVVFSGRLHPHKDVRTVLAAARRLAGGAPPGTWRFLILGDGPERAALEREAADLVAAGVVAFASPGIEVLPYVAAADAGVLMTDPRRHAEGCSNAILEYMACGLPVVAGASGGNPELVQEGVTGYLVPERDAAALADRLERLRRDPGRARAMGAAGRDRVAREFTLGRMVDAYVSLYEECLSGRSSPARAWRRPARLAARRPERVSCSRGGGSAGEARPFTEGTEEER